jgi:hypothetical protein
VSLTPVQGMDFLVFIVILPIEAAWLLMLGVLMWRRARGEPPPAGPPGR